MRRESIIEAWRGKHRTHLLAYRGHPTQRSACTAPNELWWADFKAEFKLGNGHYCYPLTATDRASRFLLLFRSPGINAQRSRHYGVQATLHRARLLPQAMRSDNGVPFASPNALFNLSK